nr:MAG TPA_asm: hypothetical protein [Caudoviricetes sp.]
MDRVKILVKNLIYSIDIDMQSIFRPSLISIHFNVSLADSFVYKFKQTLYINYPM